MLVLNPYPQTPFPGKGAILLGLPPLDPVGGYAPATPFLYNQEVYRQSEGSAETLPSDYSLKISIVEFSHKLFYKLLTLVCGILNGNFI